MPPSHLLTRYRQSVSALSATSDNTSRSSHSTRPSFRGDSVPEDWLSRPLLPHFINQTPTPAQRRRSSSRTADSPDLFATLLFDRVKAYDHNAQSLAPEAAVSDQRSTPHIISRGYSHYQDSACRIARKNPQYNREPAFSARRNSLRSSSESEFPDAGMSLVSHLKSKAPPKVSKRRAKTPKKVTTKKKKKMAEVTSKKRPAESDENVEQRPAKVAKVEAKASIGEKMSNSSNSSTNTIIETPLPEVIYISDSEEEKPNLQNEPQSPYLPHPASANNSQSSLQLSKFHPPTDAHDRQSWIKVDLPDKVPDFTPELLSPANDNTKAAEELHKLRLELQTESEKSKELQQELERRDTALQENNKSRSERAQFLQRQLDAERQATRDATKECAQLREQLRRCQERLAIQETEHQAQLAENEQQKSAVEGESEILHGTVRGLNTEAKDLRNQMSGLQDDKARTTATETAASSSFCSIPALSLEPSLCSSSITVSTEAEIKTDNVRKRYLKVNRELTILQAIARNMVTCTRSMDLTSFGDFGKYANQLRKALEDEDNPQNSPSTPSFFVRKADDEDDGGSQRSGG